MDAVRLAPTAGIVACVAVLAALGVPYLLVERAAEVGAYYGTGAISPLAAGLFALISIVVFAAGRQGRSDPNTVAGVGLVFGVFVLLLSLAWAVTIPTEVVLGLSADPIIRFHRWALVVLALGPPASGVWYARALGLL